MILILGIAGIPAGVNAYQALTETPQPTTTITAPPPYNPLINPTIDYGNLECPENGSNPVGWGTVTPSSAWLLLCSQCVNASDWSTSTPSNTNTPNPTLESMTQIACQTAAAGGSPCTTPTVTVTPTATITPTATGTPTGGGMECLYLINGQCWNGGVVSYTHEFTINGFNNNYFADLIGVHVQSPYNTLVNIYYAYDITISWSNADSRYAPTLENHLWARDPQSGWNTNIDSNYSNACTPGTSGTCNHTYQKQQPFTNGNPNNQGTDFYVNIKNNNVSWPSGDNIAQGWVYISISSLPTTPTPTATGTPGTDLSYCQTVHDEETGFDWTGISYGNEYCIDIGPYGGFDFGGLTANPIGAFPWIAHICFQDISFGELTVFDVVISLEAILYILGIVAIIRNLFVS